MALRPYEQYEADAKAHAKQRFSKWLLPIVAGLALAGGVGGAFASLGTAALCALGGAVLGFLIHASIKYFSASSEAEKTYTTDWCALHGCTFVGEYKPANGPHANSGHNPQSSGALTGELNGLPTYLYNFSYYTTQSNGKTTQEVEHPFKILQIWGLELPIASLAFTERGFLGKIRMFDRIEGATTSQRVVELESTEFNEKFKLEVADSADEVWIRRIFDPETIQALVADTFEIPNISYYDRCFWLVEGGHYKAKELDAMLTWQGNAVQAIRHLARVQSL